MTRAAFRFLRDRIAAHRVCFIVYPNGARIRGTERNIRESTWDIARGNARVIYEFVGLGNDNVRCVGGKQ